MIASAEQLAQRFHETYERLAPSFEYETWEASAKSWSDVPEQNRALMVAVCAELAEALHLPPSDEVREEARHRATWSKLPCGGPDLKCTVPEHHEVRTVYTGPWRPVGPEGVRP